MEITKLEHACLVVRKDGAALVVDPGNYTRPVDVTGAVGVVITHEHPDHVTPEQLRRVLDQNPGIPVMGPAGVAAALAESVPEVVVDVVTDGDVRTVGPFALTFHGTRHQLIHSTVPVVDNTGVMVDGRFFYPGDAYTDPGVPVEVLATPVGAPWLKVAEMMDYVAALRPGTTFPTHERTLSDAGFAQGAMRIAQMTEPAGRAVVLQPGETLAI
ncbi:MAG: MBL fold metallo-hydrolase [Williamsia herbipolensis]|nr:MBL fold metallo-hydrolase [Williamsia herbipolensis]